MQNRSIYILLVEDNPADARLIQELVAEAKSANIEFKIASTLKEGLEKFNASTYDAVLLDLSLPDSTGMDTFHALRSEVASTPILLLTGLKDEELAIQAVREGAQDYLVKGQVEGALLVRAVNYAIERHRLLAQLEEAKAAAQRLNLIDDLTGLNNRRGFFTLCEQQWKLANRRKHTLILIYCDLDNLKRINDEGGHQLGDDALIEVANILRSTFRESDIIARMGGDEFAILAIEGEGDGVAMLTRLKERLREFNASGAFNWPLSISAGYAHYHPGDQFTIDDVIAQADANMYEQKQQNKGSAIRGQ
jgi:diguanylate cyclase (GGDEF)-like protein